MSGIKERPILFSAPMVRALLAGTKTQTRRVVKAKYLPWLENIVLNFLDGQWNQRPLPYGKPGDRLWCKETFFAFGRWETRFSAKKGRDELHFVDMTLETGHAYQYAAEGAKPALLDLTRHGGVTPAWWKRPAIFMPRAASRITLEITGVRVERLQDISDADAQAEVCGMLKPYSDHWQHRDVAKEEYRLLWESINGSESWEMNPWVWVVSFRRMEACNAST